MNIKSLNNFPNTFFQNNFNNNRIPKKTNHLKTNISTQELFNQPTKNRIGNQHGYDFEKSMKTDIISSKYGMNDLMVLNESGSSIEINMHRSQTIDYIEKLVSKDNYYRNHIETNFSGIEKKSYLKSLNENINHVKEKISASISKVIGNEMNFNDKELEDFKISINSIISDRIKGINLSTKATSLKNLNYNDLKNIVSALKGIDRSTQSSYNTNEQLSGIGLLAMKNKFIAAKTNLPDVVKTKFSDLITNRTQNLLKEKLHFLKLSHELDMCWNREEGIIVDEEAEELKLELFFKKIQKNFSELKDKTNNINFESNNFKINFIDIIENLKSLYLETTNEPNNTPEKSGIHTSSKHIESKNKILNALSSDWNMFLDSMSLSENKDNYYISPNNGNIIDHFA